MLFRLKAKRINNSPTNTRKGKIYILFRILTIMNQQKERSQRKKIKRNLQAKKHNMHGQKFCTYLVCCPVLLGVLSSYYLMFP